MSKEELKEVIGRARSYAKAVWRATENLSKGDSYLCFLLLDYIYDALST